MTRRLAVFLVALAFAGTFYLIVRGVLERGGLAIDTTGQTYIRGWDFWGPYFREPFETVIFVFRDGQAFSFTSNIDLAIDAPPAQVQEYFARSGKTARDILVIIHNHLYPGNFSPKDRSFCRYFRECGFAGHFLLRRPGGEVVELED